MNNKKVYYNVRPVLLVGVDGRKVSGSCKRVEGKPNDCKHEFVHHWCSQLPEYICDKCEQIKPIKNFDEYLAGREAVL